MSDALDRAAASAESSATPSHWPPLFQLIRLPEQTGTLLLLLPSLWSLVLASGGHPAPELLLVFIAGSFLMRSAGVVANDLADRSFDRQVARTRQRPLAAGTLSPTAAMTTLVFLLLLAGGLLFFVNRLTLLLSPVAFLLALLYPYAKRVLHIPQAVLGVAFGWGTVMAWAAARGRLDAPAWLLFGATICWAVGYDTIYALQDREDDARIGVKSAAVLFGPRTWLAVALALTGMLLLLGLAGWLAGAHPCFYLVLAWAAGLMTGQVRRLRAGASSALALALFRQHVVIGAAILGGLWAGMLLR